MYKIIAIILLTIFLGQSNQDKIQMFQHVTFFASEQCRQTQLKTGQEFWDCVDNIHSETIKQMDSTGKDLAGNRKKACCGLKQAESCTNVLKVYNYFKTLGKP